MKLFAVCLVVGCLLVGNVYGFDEETKSRLIDIFNFTRNQYLVIVGVIDELVNEKIEPDEAEDKIIEWRDFYAKKAESAPPDAGKMCDLMNEMLDLAQKITHDYRPHYQETKNRFGRLDDLKSQLINEMTALRHKLQ